jgi:hypothetical protein
MLRRRWFCWREVDDVALCIKLESDIKMRLYRSQFGNTHLSATCKAFDHVVGANVFVLADCPMYTMSLSLYFGTPCGVPHHNLISENDFQIPITIWLLVDQEWNVLPLMAPGECLMPTSNTTGPRLEWRGVSSAKIGTHSLSHETKSSPAREPLHDCSSLVHRRGRISCKSEKLGRSTRTTLR